MCRWERRKERREAGGGLVRARYRSREPQRRGVGAVVRMRRVPWRVRRALSLRDARCFVRDVKETALGEKGYDPS